MESQVLTNTALRPSDRPHTHAPSATEPTPSPGRFAVTRWTLVLNAAQRGETQAAAPALAELCRLYWPPLYAYARRSGHPTHAAEDVTQAFFARLLARDGLANVAPQKGRFRSFMLAAFKHFLANERDKARAFKRGGGAIHIAIDADAAEALYACEPADLLTPDRLFDRQWALTVLDRVLARLRAEQGTPEAMHRFAALEPALAAESGAVGYAELAAGLGMTEGAVKVAVHRLRRRYRELLRADIADTVADPSQVEEEIRSLIAALAAV